MSDDGISGPEMGDSVTVSALHYEAAVAEIRGHYPEDIFTPESTVIDGLMGTFARSLCDQITERARAEATEDGVHNSEPYVGLDEPVLTIDPRRQFGQVCIVGTRLPAETLAWSVWAEGGVDEALRGYQATEQQALVACWWLTEQIRSLSRPRKHEKQLLDRWGDWAETAIKYLGGWLKEPCPRPPDNGGRHG